MSGILVVLEQRAARISGPHQLGSPRGRIAPRSARPLSPLSFSALHTEAARRRNRRQSAFSKVIAVRAPAARPYTADGLPSRLCNNSSSPKTRLRGFSPHLPGPRLRSRACNPLRPGAHQRRHRHRRRPGLYPPADAGPPQRQLPAHGHGPLLHLRAGRRFSGGVARGRHRQSIEQLHASH